MRKEYKSFPKLVQHIRLNLMVSCLAVTPETLSRLRVKRT